MPNEEHGSQVKTLLTVMWMWVVISRRLLSPSTPPPPYRSRGGSKWYDMGWMKNEKTRSGEKMIVRSIFISHRCGAVPSSCRMPLYLHLDYRQSSHVGILYTERYFQNWLRRAMSGAKRKMLCHNRCPLLRSWVHCKAISVENWWVEYFIHLLWEETDWLNDCRWLPAGW